MQFRYWQAVQLRLVPSIASSIFSDMMQPYGGDVTIVQEVTPRDLAGPFCSPTISVIRNLLARCDCRTFPNLDRVCVQCVVERTVDACVEAVARVAKREHGCLATGDGNDDGSGGVDGDPSGDGGGDGERGAVAKVLRRAPLFLWTDSPLHSPPPGRLMSGDVLR